MTLAEGFNITKEKRHEDTRRNLLSRFVQAMREDLSEWINSLSYNVELTPDNFLPGLDNGVILCQQARLIQRFAEEYAVLNPNENLKIPSKPVRYTEKGAFSGSFVARDNVANYIAWCKELGIQDVIIFESDDLVLHKNEKSVILSLMDVARKAYKFGVRPPEIVRFEQEIDEEIERDEECVKSGKIQPKPRDLEEDNNLDVLIRKIVNQCICEDRFPIKKLSEGKYKIGKTHTLIFVRVMRKHVMVRIGGGWDTFDHYIVKHDPCRTTIAGNTENCSPQTASNKVKTLVQKKVETLINEKIKSHASSDTQSMCSESTNSSESLDDCHPTNTKTAQKYNSLLQHSNGIEDFLNKSAVNMEQSIQEIDIKLKELEKTYSNITSTPKDTSVYENKSDRWLRSHMNAFKETKVVEKTSEQLSQENGGNRDIIRTKNCTPSVSSDEKISKKTKCKSQTELKSISRKLFDAQAQVNTYSNDSYEPNTCLCMKSSSQTNVFYCDTASQTDFSKITSQNKLLNGQSRIPVFMRSRTADAIIRNSTQREKSRNSFDRGLPLQRKRNLTESQKLIQEKNSPKLTKEKSDLTSKTMRNKSNSISLSMRRETSDLTSSKPLLRREISDLTSSKSSLRREKSDLMSSKSFLKREKLKTCLQKNQKLVFG
ncbi:uncharacterized protein LOC101236105 isoform X2 [Hydra vulgaris]|uniref:Uncharacterized protein LOC101236105 isoform X2 n=1 Tax=Hydra vulgaris TaxID=6087 RepID=A0ABM4CNJ4_HYDVU